MPRISVWMVRAALLYLGTAFTFGALMLWNKGMPFDPSLWRLWPLHVEFALIGWLVQLAMGVAAWSLPRFSRRPNRYGRIAFAWIAFGMLNAGVLLVAAGAWFTALPQWVELAGRTAELLAVVLFALFLWPRVKPLGA